MLARVFELFHLEWGPSTSYLIIKKFPSHLHLIFLDIKKLILRSSSLVRCLNLTRFDPKAWFLSLKIE